MDTQIVLSLCPSDQSNVWMNHSLQFVNQFNRLIEKNHLKRMINNGLDITSSERMIQMNNLVRNEHNELKRAISHLSDITLSENK